MSKEFLKQPIESLCALYGIEPDNLRDALDDALQGAGRPVGWEWLRCGKCERKLGRRSNRGVIRIRHHKWHSRDDKELVLSVDILGSTRVWCRACGQHNTFHAAQFSQAQVTRGEVLAHLLRSKNKFQDTASRTDGKGPLVNEVAS